MCNFVVLSITGTSRLNTIFYFKQLYFLCKRNCSRILAPADGRFSLYKRQRARLPTLHPHTPKGQRSSPDACTGNLTFPRAAFRAFFINEEGPLNPANLPIPPAKSRLGFLGTTTPMGLGGEHSGVPPEILII